MKILHVIDELKVGGAQTHLATMLDAALVRYPTFQHSIFGLTDDGPIGERLRQSGLPVTALGLTASIRERRLDRVFTRLFALIRSERPDVVEAHLTWSRLLGLTAARVLGVPVRVGYEQGDTYFKSLPFRAANFTLQLAAQRIVVCSAALGEWAHQTHRISRERLWVLHNCVDVSRFALKPSDGPETCGALWEFPATTTVFATVGSLGHGVNKRVDVSIRAIAAAVAQGADVALLIVGDGPQRSELERLAAELAVEERVRFLGIRADIPQILARCDAFCHTAPFEPFGIVCVEAMAVGLPVVVPDQGGMREAVIHERTGLVYRTLDHAELAKCMVALGRSPALRRELGQASRRRAEESFSSTAYVDELYGGYAELLAGGGRVKGTPRPAM